MDGLTIIIDPIKGLSMTKSKNNVEQVKKSDNCSFQEIKRLFTDFYNEDEKTEQSKGGKHENC